MVKKNSAPKVKEKLDITDELIAERRTSLKMPKDMIPWMAITIEFINYPNDRVMFITNCGGKNIVNAETFGQIEEWGKSQGATKARSYAKKGQSKLYLQKLGCNIMNYVMEKKL